MCTDEVCKWEELAKQNAGQYAQLEGVGKGNKTRREMALAGDMDKAKEKCDVIEATEKKTFQGENH